MNDMKPFKFWSQSVLPLVYDDSLSYYEVLCKIVTYVNGLVENNNEIIKEVGDLTTLVNNFIEESDIPGVVKEELVKMIENGDLDEIIADALEEYEAEINQRINAVDLKVDNVKNRFDAVFYPVYPTDSVADIKAAIANHTAIKFTEGTYVFPVEQNYDAGISIPSNRIIWLDNAELKVEANALGAYEVLLIEDASNVYVYGGKITGDKLEHTGDGGEWGDCISVTGGTNVIIDNVTMSNGWGDGCEVYRSENLTFKNCLVVDNRRNGISVMSGNNIDIRDCTFKNNGGTAPGCGVDIETNDTNDNLGLVIVEDCKFFNTVGENSINAYSHSSCNVKLFNNMCDKGIATGTAVGVDDISAFFEVADCVCNHIYVGRGTVTSFTKYNNVSIRNFNGSYAVRAAYGDSCYNLYMNDIVIENSTCNFAFSCGTIYDSEVHIKIIKSGAYSWEGTLERSILDIVNTTTVTQHDYTNVTGTTTRYILDDTTPVNALNWEGIPIGTTIELINTSVSGKNMTGLGSMTLLYAGAHDTDHTFGPNSVTTMKRISSTFILFTYYKNS